MGQEPLVSYLETPATPDEREIASLLERIVAAINTKNLTLLRSVYAEDATVRMSTNKQEVLTLPEYIGKLGDLVPRVRRLRMSDALIRANDQTARAFCTSALLLYSAARPALHQRYFNCEKRHGLWRITEAGYLDG